MGRCQRIGQILDGRIERAEKQRCTERFFVLRRRSYRLQRSNHGCLSKARIQRCIIHQIRSSTRFVSYKHIKEFMKDLKQVYQANTEEQAMSQLAAFGEKWEKQYPTAVHSWEENWDILSTYFDYPVEIRKIIYTTNAIEGLNQQFRKVTKTKNVFPNDDSLRKMLYLAIQNLSSRWTQRCRNWDLIINQLRIMDSNKE